MTEQPPTHSAPALPGERSVVFTFDDLGRVASCTEHHQGSVEVAGDSHYLYDDDGRLLQVSQSFNAPLSNPCTP